MNLISHFASKRLAIAASLLLLGLTACNTVEGAGKDIESAGDKIENSANKNNTYKHRSR